MLSIENLGVELADGDRRFRLRVDQLEIRRGETIGISGPSGTGKTLLLELLGLLRKPDNGGCYNLVSRDGAPTDLCRIWSDSAVAPARARLRGSLFGFVPQSGGLVPFLTLRDNVRLTQEISGRLDPGWIDTLCDRLGLVDVQNMLPGKLSIGQRQRASVARALAHRPEVLIADEPTAALDPANAAETMRLLFEVAAIEGNAMLLSTHDLDLLERFPTRRLSLRLTDGARPGTLESRLAPADGA